MEIQSPITAVFWAANLVLLALHASGACVSPPSPGSDGDAPLSGRAVHRSDVQGIPDSPYDHGEIILFREGLWPELMEALAVEDQTGAGTGDTELSGTLLQESHLSRFAAARTPLEEGGTFAFRVPSETYRLCVANLGEDRPRGPFLIFGCTRVEIRTGSNLHVQATFGEAGFQFHFQE